MFHDVPTLHGCLPTTAQARCQRMQCFEPLGVRLRSAWCLSVFLHGPNGWLPRSTHAQFRGWVPSTERLTAWFCVPCRDSARIAGARGVSIAEEETCSKDSEYHRGGNYAGHTLYLGHLSEAIVELGYQDDKAFMAIVQRITRPHNLEKLMVRLHHSGWLRIPA